ncbi:MAG: TetR/AcrR family transcriptional regulator [Bacteroidales bacterium]|jgi:AcrR family transcriptional regulator|nr:TetR/AcrR family transcriptional regulator [Bacteroidales bacterium]
MNAKSTVKDTIMARALELFSAKGYEGVSVNELTEAAGITKPTLYYYFGSKEGLFDAVSQFHYARLNSKIKENALYTPNPEVYEEDIFKVLSNITKVYFSFARENETFYRCILANLSMPRSSAVFKIVEKYHFVQFSVIDNMFKSMAKAHGNLKGKTKTLAWSFIGAVNSYIGLHFSGFAVQDLNEKSVKELVHQFMHGIYA